MNKKETKVDKAIQTPNSPFEKKARKLGSKKPVADVVLKKPLLDDDDEDIADLGKVVSKIEMDQLTLKGKMWSIKMRIETLLPETCRRYHILLELDERKYTRRIKELEKGLDESLFKEERVSRKELNQKIGKINDERMQMRRDCKPIEFDCVVEQVKYQNDGTLLTANIPDDVIEPLNRQKFRMEAYKVTLQALALFNSYAKEK